MKKINLKSTKNIIIAFICLLFFAINSSFCFNQLHALCEENKVSNNQKCIVLDSYSGRVIYEENSNEKAYMASTTKILTAITVIDNCKLDEQVLITKEMCGIEGSSIYLEVGEILTVKDLLYGLMLRSGNDCAVALAIHCSKSIRDFAILMNETANKIGAKSSNFTNPHGLHDSNHYTTAYDLALITRYAMKNQSFREIVGCKSIRIPFTTRNTVRLLKNKNKMLSLYEGCNGVKTGYTKKSGRCLVSSCNKNGLEFICVVLNCPPMWEKSAELLDYCYDNFNKHVIAKKDDIYDFIDVKDSNEQRGLYIKNDLILPLKTDEIETLNIVKEYPREIKKETKKDECIGNIKIYIKNNLIFTEKIYTI